MPFRSALVPRPGLPAILLSVAFAVGGLPVLDIPLVAGPTHVLETLDRSRAREERNQRARESGSVQTRPVGLEELKQDLRRGSFGRIEAAAPKLLAARPDDPQINGLYGILLATRGEVDAARASMAKARGSQLSLQSAQLIEALILRHQGDPSGARRVAQQAVDRDPAHPFAWNVLGRAALDAGDTAKALQAFRRAVELNEQFYPGHLNVGAVALQLGDANLAITSFTKASQLEPDAAAPRYGLALSLESLGQYAPAIDQLRQGLSRNREDPLLLPKLTELLLTAGQASEAYTQALAMERLDLPGSAVMLADASLRQAEYDRAATHLGKAPPEDPNRHYLDGCRLIALQQYEQALGAMVRTLSSSPGHLGAPLAVSALRTRLGQSSGLTEEGIILWPESIRPMARFLLGCDYVARNNPSAGLAQWQAAEGFVAGFSMAGTDAALLQRSLSPESAADLALGVLLNTKGMKAAAHDVFERIGEANPDSFVAYYWRGIAALDSGDRARARTLFIRSVETAPTFFSGLYVAGELSFSAGDTSAAAAFFQRAQAVKPDSGLSMRLGLLKENAGDLVQAEQQYREVIRLAPDFFAGYNQLAWFLASRGQKLDEALQLAQRADSLHPGNSSILDTLGWIHHLQKRPDLALEHLRRAAAANPANPTIWYHLAVVQYTNTNVADALKALEKALSLPTPFNDREAATRLLETLRNRSVRTPN